MRYMMFEAFEEHARTGYSRSVSHAYPSSHENELLDSFEEVRIRAHKQGYICHRARRYDRGLGSLSALPRVSDCISNAWDCPKMWAKSFQNTRIFSTRKTFYAP